MRRIRPPMGFIGLVLLASPFACDRPPPAESLQEWSPTDHHSVDDGRKGAAQPAAGRAPADKGESPDDNVAELVDLTWRQQCTTCHGASGKGDGQMGPMVKAPDLTNGDWQASVSDADVAALIKNGRNRMPKFDLPGPVIAGLVARVRALRQP